MRGIRVPRGGRPRPVSLGFGRIHRTQEPYTRPTAFSAVAERVVGLGAEKADTEVARARRAIERAMLCVCNLRK